jgi:hypothetical protein
MNINLPALNFPGIFLSNKCYFGTIGLIDNYLGYFDLAANMFVSIANFSGNQNIKGLFNKGNKLFAQISDVSSSSFSGVLNEYKISSNTFNSTEIVAPSSNEFYGLGSLDFIRPINCINKLFIYTKDPTNGIAKKGVYEFNF